MHLADYIVENIEPILREWESFARTILPETSGMNRAQLRDQAEAILLHIAYDMKGKQTAGEQKAKSEGRRDVVASGNGAGPGEQHATDRQASGFSLMQLISEYRALRASVIRLWTKDMGTLADRETLDELTRFNEAIDELQNDSIEHFSKHLDQSRDLLLAVLGHDLRDPLGVIVTYSAYLVRADGLDESATKAVARLFATATQMRLMVSDLLDFARTRLGSELPITRTPMEMGEACRRAMDETEAFHPRSTLRMQSGGRFGGEWDAGRISQLLSNLLGNAVQHGLPESPVNVVLSGNDNQVSIAVHNNGEPIPASEMETIFEPMVRGSREMATPSSVGLGLFIAREVTRAHGGTISVESSADTGTTFTVLLPRRALASQATATNSPT